MKLKLPILIFFAGIMATAQVPTNYYDSADGLTGYELKTELHNIISSGHNPQSYNDLWTVFQTSDDDQYYEHDGSVLDIYSENPTGSDPYEFTFVSNQCGNYSGEADCYNREHLMPQSWFDESAPMVTDMHHIYPTDGYVNGVRGHLPFGEVGSANYTSGNGSKRGNNILSGYNGTVFEPIDEFKGDIARVYFYMATRYENNIGSWENANDGSSATLDGSSDQVFEDWMLTMLLNWHTNDPVSQKEIDRNNDAYDYQGNANPFINHPEYVDIIWNGGMGIDDIAEETFQMYPNPVASDRLTLRFATSEETNISIYNILGKQIMNSKVEKTEVRLNISNLKSGIYLLKIVRDGKLQVRKLVRE